VWQCIEILRWGSRTRDVWEDPTWHRANGRFRSEGLQGPEDAKYKKTLACAKHYAVHSGPEWSRHALNLNHVTRVIMGDLPPRIQSFSTESWRSRSDVCVSAFGRWAVLWQHSLLQNILREQWDLNIGGSDCGAIETLYSSHKVSSDGTHAASQGVSG